MKQNAKTEDKLIVDALCLADKVSAYSLHQNFRLSPGQVVLAVSRLEKLGIAHFEGNDIARSSEFAAKLLRYRHAIYHRGFPWKSPNLRDHRRP